MKKIPIILLSLFVIFFWGCKKDTQTTSPLAPPVKPPVKPQISVTVNQDTIKKGESVTFIWTSIDATSCTVNINGVKETLQVNGTKSYTLNQNTSFQFTFTSKDGLTESKTFAIIITEIPPPPTIHVSANPTQIPFGGRSIITITTTYTDSITSTLVGVHGTSGSFSTPSLLVTTTYFFKAWGKGGTMSDSIKVIVDPKPPLTDEEKLEKTPWRKISCFYDTINLYRELIVDPIQNCAKDDSLKFRIDYIFEDYQGVILCDPSWPQLFGNGAWSLTYSGSQIILNLNYNPANVIQLDSTILKIQYPVECIGLSYPYRYYTDTYTNVWPVAKIKLHGKSE